MDEEMELWDNSWLRDELTEGFPQSSVVDSDTLAKVTPIITFRETRAYTESYDGDGAGTTAGNLTIETL